MNVRRRQLTPSQLAEAARESLPLLEAEAAERKAEKCSEAGAMGGRGNVKGERNIALTLLADPDDDDQEADVIAHIVHPKPASKAADEAAAMFGVSARYIEDAKAIHKVAPELSENVRTGTMTIPQARREVKRREVVAETRQPSGAAGIVRESLSRLPACLCMLLDIDTQCQYQRRPSWRASSSTRSSYRLGSRGPGPRSAHGGAAAVRASRTRGRGCSATPS